MSPVIFLVLQFLVGLASVSGSIGLTTNKDEVCYHVPSSKSASGAHEAASQAVFVGGPLERVDYSLLPS
ncbi:TPA_asm: hypothetical protein [ssRNA phage Esthiorhiza.2_49]|uniref:Uncharacterized protein n=2 Tax=Fiersviridae TaxID=2842319 RepID=A0A8S5L0Y5_9VIRU|nr:hypothetical protein QIJ81_gp1 [ssRNA phage Esthiorhiza.2_49]QDH86673.1 MAG: hypothetical protein H2RhizoLitter7429_000004 [Leviviridae sp.]DAD51566.1 TPA_asm: hypothetical protein [ssRNA phage Esthiorhiza.2_49]